MMVGKCNNQHGLIDVGNEENRAVFDRQNYLTALPYNAIQVIIQYLYPNKVSEVFVKSAIHFCNF